MPRPGDKLGHCRVMDLIATGGMANVYRVWHEQLEVVRALKILKPGFTQESRARLETEAKISANIRHPNIVEVYGVGYWNDAPFIEMEYVDGQSLRQLLDIKGKVPIPFALSVIHTVCTALHFAGSQKLTLYGKVYDGLIHRDIKPANILIDNKGRVKLADFGIARPCETNIHTVESKVMGTFAYLSPEQLNGENLDQRCDIYALAAVLYEMITGSKVYPQKFLTQLVQHKSTGTYTPIRAHVNKGPHQLFQLIEKALSTGKNERQNSIEELDSEITELIRTMSPKTPEEIIAAYISQNETTEAPVRTPEKKLSRWIIPFALSAMICGAFFLYLSLSDGQKRNEGTFETAKTVSRVKEIQKQKNASTPDTSSTHNDEEDTEKNTVFSTRPGNSASPFVKGVEAYKRRDFRIVIPELEKAIQEKQSPSKADSSVLFLADAYLETGQQLKAEMILKSRTISDPFYDYLLGRAYFSTGRLQKADRILSVMHMRESGFRGNLEREISYLKASVRDGLYVQKPNSENQNLAIRGWTDYLEKYCAGQPGGAQGCSEAREKLEQLTPENGS
ncbi:MAG: protein kinase domain-containing protein [Fibrobacterota bacterium]